MSWDDIGGLENVKRELQEVRALFYSLKFIILSFCLTFFSLSELVSM